MLKAALRELMKSGYIHRENAHNPERKIGARRITVPAIKVAEIYYRHG
jgi:DNA-binding HxlR family transcriptional regulator